MFLDFLRRLFGIPTMQDKIDYLEKLVAEKEELYKKRRSND
jgi:hypothetical protein